MNRIVPTTHDAELFSESFGTPGDPALLLVMGALSSGRWWPDEFCRMLAERGRHVIRYDHRDTGASTCYEPGAAPYSVLDLADDALAVLDAHGVSAAHFVGMSLGGFLSQIVALKQPRRVRSLTLIASEPLASPDPSVPPIDQAVIDYHTGAGEIDWSDRAAVVAFQVGAWRLLTGPERSFDAEAAAATAAADFDRTANALAMYNHAMLDREPGLLDAWNDRLHEISQPALIVHGTHDRVLSYPNALRLQALLPGAELLTLDGAGHELNRADWPAIVDAIARRTA